MAVVTSSSRVAGRVQAAEVASLLYVQAPGHARASLAERLSGANLVPVIAADVAEALRLLADRPVACCLIDLADDRLALTSLRLIRARHPKLAVAGVVDPLNAVAVAEAVQAGIVDLLPWPFTSADMLVVLGNAIDRAVGAVATDTAGDSVLDWFLASSAMRGVRDAVREAAATRLGVAVSGERGSGRERIARAIHALGGQATPFVAVDCARQPQDEIERRMFGVGAGRPAGDGAGDHLAADAAILQANRGTLFVANVADLPARLQVRLARLLRDHEAEIGQGRTVDLDVRLVVALADAPDAAVADGRLRRDLADRVATHIVVPALRERRDDIPQLVVRIARDACARQGVPPKVFSRSALAVLGALSWPGNTAELEEVIGQITDAVRAPVVQLDDVLAHAPVDGLGARADMGGTLREARMRFERECISATLVRHHGRVGEAAKALGIQRTNLYRKVRQLKVDKALLSARRS